MVISGSLKLKIHIEKNSNRTLSTKSPFKGNLRDVLYDTQVNFYKRKDQKNKKGNEECINEAAKDEPKQGKPYEYDNCNISFSSALYLNLF